MLCVPKQSGLRELRRILLPMLVLLPRPLLHSLLLESSIAICRLSFSLRAHDATLIYILVVWRIGSLFHHIWCTVAHVEVVVFADASHQSFVVTYKGSGNLLLFEI